MNRTYEVTLVVTVHDETALAGAAAEVAERSMTAEEWAAMRQDGGAAVENDLLMLLDPGVSPDGIEIEESSVGGSL
jgi:hypothetical protein